MKAIVNTEITDLPQMFKVVLGKDTRGFDIWLNMTITKETKDHWDRRGSARDIYLNELDWYYEIRFDFDSNMRSESYKFDHSTEEGKKAHKEWYLSMTDGSESPLPLIIDHSRESWLFDIFRRDYKEIFSELYIDEDTYLKILRAAKRANDNNQKIYTHKQMQIINKVVSYYRTTFSRIGSYEINEGLRDAGLENDRDYDMDKEYLVSVVSNSRIEKLIDMIPPNLDNVGGGLNMLEKRKSVMRFIENRKKKNNRKNAIDSILQ